LQLTEAQVATAEAQGCRFVPASEGQVRQYSMQRRVFQVKGQAFLIMRHDGFYETAGTLLALIANAPIPATPASPPPVLPIEPAPAPEPEIEAAPEPKIEVAPEPEQPPKAEAVAEHDADADADADADEVVVEDAAPAKPPRQAILSLPEPQAGRRTQRGKAARAEALVEPPAPATPEAQADVMAAMRTITTGYVAGHQVDATQLTDLLTTVHRSLRALPRKG